MPRAVLISVGELSLKPIKTLVEANNVTVATIAVSDTASLKTLESLTNKLSEQEQGEESCGAEEEGTQEGRWPARIQDRR